MGKPSISDSGIIEVQELEIRQSLQMNKFTVGEPVAPKGDRNNFSVATCLHLSTSLFKSNKPGWWLRCFQIEIVPLCSPNLAVMIVARVVIGNGAGSLVKVK